VGRGWKTAATEAKALELEGKSTKRGRDKMQNIITPDGRCVSIHFEVAEKRHYRKNH